MKTVPLLLAAALLLTGCGGSDDAQDSSASSTAGRAEGGSLDRGSSEGGSSEGGSAPAGAQPLTPGAPDTAGTTDALGRVSPTDAVVRTGSLEVVVDDVSKAADEAVRLTLAAGGRLESDERSSAGVPEGGGQAVSLRLRVPPDAFDSTVTAVSRLGQERSRQLGGQIVTEQVADLESRVASQQASVDRVRALLAQAKDLGEVVQVEAELTRRTADLESLQARRAALTAQVDLGTLELRLLASDGAPALGSGPLGFGDGLSAGWDALRAVGRAVGVTAGALLPWSPLLLGLALLVRRTWRRPAPPLAGTPAPTAGGA